MIKTANTVTGKILLLISPDDLQKINSTGTNGAGDLVAFKVDLQDVIKYLDMHHCRPRSLAIICSEDVGLVKQYLQYEKTVVIGGHSDGLITGAED